MPGRDVEQQSRRHPDHGQGGGHYPVAVKLEPFFSSAGEVAIRLDQAGADGLVLFNRFMQADIDPETLTVSTGLKLSSPAEAALPRSGSPGCAGLVGASLARQHGVEDRGRCGRLPAGGRRRGDDHLVAAAPRAEPTRRCWSTG